MWRRWLPSLTLFVSVQAAAAAWIFHSLFPSQVGTAIRATALGPLNLLLRLDRLGSHGVWPRDAVVLALLLAIALLPWVHAWRPRRHLLVLPLLGSLLWAAAGFLFTIDHL